MGRRELLTEDERTLLFGVPVDEAGLARYYTLTPEDLELLLAKRGARNALGPRTNIRVTRGHFTWPRHCTMATRGSSTPVTGHYAALQHISAMGQHRLVRTTVVNAWLSSAIREESGKF